MTHVRRLLCELAVPALMLALVAAVLYLLGPEPWRDVTPADLSDCTDAACPLHDRPRPVSSGAVVP